MEPVLDSYERQIVAALLRNLDGAGAGWRLAEQLVLSVFQPGGQMLPVDTVRQLCQRLIGRGILRVSADEQGARWYYLADAQAMRTLLADADPGEPASLGPRSRPSVLAARALA